MQEVTRKVMLLEGECDLQGYTTYVFECLEYNDYDDQYIMCVKYPNWQQYPIEKGDIGYLRVRYVEEGVDRWFDGVEFVPYKQTDIIFMQFVKEREEIKVEQIVID